MSGPIYDVAVIGLGAVGSSALNQLARRGARAVGIDRFSPPHDRGSSHGESRITRQAIGEGEAYVPLVLRSNALWEELETQTGTQLLERCGFLYITRDDAGTSHHGKSRFLDRTRRAAQAFNIAHEMIDASEITRRFPQFTGLAGDEQAYYEPGGGYVRPERCIAAALESAAALGARIVRNRRVHGVQRGDGDVRLQLDDEVIVAGHAIVATGAWIGEIAGPAIDCQVEVHRQLLHWFQRTEDVSYHPGAMPTFVWTHGLETRDQFYGFPPIDGLVKVAREDYAGAFDPDTDARSVDPADGAVMAQRHVRGRLAGLSALPVRSASCHYAVTPDADFLIDGDPQMQIVSACSGHGFKHAAAIGEAVAQIAISEAPLVNLAPFGAARFNI